MTQVRQTLPHSWAYSGHFQAQASFLFPLGSNHLQFSLAHTEKNPSQNYQIERKIMGHNEPKRKRKIRSKYT